MTGPLQPPVDPALLYSVRAPSLVPTEVQRLERKNVAVEYGPHAYELFEMVVFDKAGGSHGVSGEAKQVTEGQAWILPPSGPSLI